MTKSFTGNSIEHLSWDEVARRIASGACAILPVGAGSKEHGFHLPMNADQLQAEWFAARVADRIDAIVWPTVTYGYYPAFAAYAGSATLSAATFEAVIEEIVAGIVRFGCRIVFVLDIGISTVAPIQRALARFDADQVLHLQIHYGPRYQRAAVRLAEQSHGSHADELETSLMLALAPDCVVMQRAEASPPRERETSGPLTPSDAASENYSRSGSYGDPTLASRAKGDVLLKAMLDDLLEQAAGFIAETVAARSAVTDAKHQSIS